MKYHPENTTAPPYPMENFAQSNLALAPHLKAKKDGQLTIDFENPKAVYELNKSLILHHFGLKHWDIPEGFLVPGVPGRVEYILAIKDFLESMSENWNNPTSILLDIGTGPSLIYPIAALKLLRMKSVASDVNPQAVKVANAIAAGNPSLKNKIIVRHQPEANKIFSNIILPEESFLVSVCNPPFYSSVKEVEKAATRKATNLSLDQVALNFKGRENELVYPGGELRFIGLMINESLKYKTQVKWFSTLVSKNETLLTLLTILKEIGGVKSFVLPLNTSNKVGRILVWTWE